MTTFYLFLIFYYIFSILFMIGYVKFGSMKLWGVILFILILALTSPILMPFNIGWYISKRSQP